MALMELLPLEILQEELFPLIDLPSLLSLSLASKYFHNLIYKTYGIARRLPLETVEAAERARFDPGVHFDPFDRRVPLSHSCCELLLACLFYSHRNLFKYFVIYFDFKTTMGAWDNERVGRFALALDEVDLVDWFDSVGGWRHRLLPISVSRAVGFSGNLEVLKRYHKEWEEVGVLQFESTEMAVAAAKAGRAEVLFGIDYNLLEVRRNLRVATACFCAALSNGTVIHMIPLDLSFSFSSGSLSFPCSPFPPDSSSSSSSSDEDHFSCRFISSQRS